jgi:DNA-binding LacI/PurR family transcriptional regulator
LLGVTFDVRQPFHGDLVEALYTAAESAGYEVALSAVAPTRDEPRAIQSLLDYRCETLILLGPTLPAAALASLATDQPVIVVGRKVRAAGVDVVRTDDSAGARLATEHLLSLGHTSIAHVDGGKSAGATERRAGYRATMRRAGLTPLVIPSGPTEDDGSLAAKLLLDTHPTATAVFTFNDRSAVGFLDTIRQSSVEIPRDLSVIGYDNTTIAAVSHINLTTIAQDAHALAHHTITRATTPTPTTETTITPHLHPRTTTAPPAQLGHGRT